MNEKTKKVLGIGGAIAIAIGTGAMFVSGASLDGASGIVGLAFAAAAAIASLISGVKK
jgi:hypothetical protein